MERFADRLRPAKRMSLDDLVLSLQRGVDRLVRRLRRGAAPVRTHRRLLIVQIDGLSRVVLERGLASGRMPFLKRLLRRHGYHLEPMTVGLPTSTPAFQMAVMYGVRPDIPGFHYYDRERRMDIHFPRPGHAALVEAKQAAGRRGILHGGSAYGCVFTGGADNNLFSFASLMRPTGHGLLCALSPCVVMGWVCVKSLLRTTLELVRAMSRLVAHPEPGDRVMLPPASVTRASAASATKPSINSSLSISEDARRQAEREKREPRRAAHRGDVGEIDRERLPADVARRAEPAIEVDAFDQRVGREHVQRAARRLYHRGIVADAEGQPGRRGGTRRGCAISASSHRPRSERSRLTARTRRRGSRG